MATCFMNWKTVVEELRQERDISTEDQALDKVQCLQKDLRLQSALDLPTLARVACLARFERCGGGTVTTCSGGGFSICLSRHRGTNARDDAPRGRWTTSRRETRARCLLQRCFSTGYLRHACASLALERLVRMSPCHFQSILGKGSTQGLVLSGRV